MNYCGKNIIFDCHASIEQNMTNKQKNQAESGKNGLPLAPVRG